MICSSFICCCLLQAKKVGPACRDSLLWALQCPGMSSVIKSVRCLEYRRLNVDNMCNLERFAPHSKSGQSAEWSKSGWNGFTVLGEPRAMFRNWIRLFLGGIQRFFSEKSSIDRDKWVKYLVNCIIYTEGNFKILIFFFLKSNTNCMHSSNRE